MSFKNFSKITKTDSGGEELVQLFVKRKKKINTNTAVA